MSDGNGTTNDGNLNVPRIHEICHILEEEGDSIYFIGLNPCHRGIENDLAYRVYFFDELEPDYLHVTSDQYPAGATIHKDTQWVDDNDSI